MPFTAWPGPPLRRPVTGNLILESWSNWEIKWWLLSKIDMVPSATFNAYAVPLRAGDRPERTGFIRKKRGGVKHGRPVLRPRVSSFVFRYSSFLRKVAREPARIVGWFWIKWFIFDSGSFTDDRCSLSFEFRVSNFEFPPLGGRGGKTWQASPAF